MYSSELSVNKMYHVVYYINYVMSFFLRIRHVKEIMYTYACKGIDCKAACVYTIYISEYIYIYGYGSIPIIINSNGMNIHLPTILMFTRGTRF